MSNRQKQAVQNNVIHIIAATLKKNRGKVCLLLSLIILLVAGSLLPPQLLRFIIDKNLNAKKVEGLALFAGLYLLTIVTTGALEFIKGVMLTKLGQRIIHNIRTEMMEKLSHIPMLFFRTNGAGTITSRFTTDVESINTLFANGIISMAIDSLKILGILISMAVFAYSLAGITLFLIPIIFVISRAFQKRMLKAQNRNLEQLGRVGNHITESIGNIQMIKLFSKECYMEDRYCERLSDNYDTRQKVNFFDSVYAPIIQIIRAVIITAVILAGSEHFQFLGITAGMLAASVELLSDLLKPIEALGMEFQNIQQGISGIQRVDTFLNLPQEYRDETLKAEDILKSSENVGGAAVRFEHVTFSYEQGQEVLHDISFEAKAGESIVLAGRTGVGKSTIMNLLLGFLEPQEGEIYVNQTPANVIPDKEKRKLFGYVEQQFQFVPGNVLEQITLGKPEITRETVIDVCKFIGLHNYIERLNNGYETQVQNGSEFSFGQRQLLSIARAIVLNPPILLLDEMTANLDSETEERVVQVLEKACKNRTIINIAHRAGAIQEKARVIHIENGRLV